GPGQAAPDEAGDPLAHAEPLAQALAHAPAVRDPRRLRGDVVPVRMRARRRRAWMARVTAGVAVAGLVALGGAMPHGARARAQAPAGGPTAGPELGPAYGAVLLGSAPSGASGDPAEAWAYALLSPSLASSPVVGGTPLDRGPGGGRQLTLLRYTSAD